MLQIFAKHNTDEKAAIWCHPSQNRAVMIKLNQEYGGNWLLVDECKTGGEILKFNDGQIYKGFNPEQERYSSAITKFNPYR